MTDVRQHVYEKDNLSHERVAPIIQDNALSCVGRRTSLRKCRVILRSPDHNKVSHHEIHVLNPPSRICLRLQRTASKLWFMHLCGSTVPLLSNVDFLAPRANGSDPNRVYYHIPIMNMCIDGKSPNAFLICEDIYHRLTDFHHFHKSILEGTSATTVKFHIKCSLSMILICRIHFFRQNLSTVKNRECTIFVIVVLHWYRLLAQHLRSRLNT